MKLAETLHNKIQSTIKELQRFANRPWYPILIGLLSLLDCFVVVIPNDGILISSSMLQPKRWKIFAFTISLGSTIGALIICFLVQKHGLPWILELYPGINEGEMWKWTETFFNQYGLLLVFGIGLSPLPQQPVVILSALAEITFLELTVVFFAGRILKYGLMAYIGSHSPHLLKKMWGMKSELKEVGIQLEEEKKD